MKLKNGDLVIRSCALTTTDAPIHYGIVVNACSVDKKIISREIHVHWPSVPYWKRTPMDQDDRIRTRKGRESKLTLKAGDLVKFGYVYHECGLNNKMAIYLGKACRDWTTKGGEYHAIWSPDSYQVIDRGLLKYLKKIGKQKRRAKAKKKNFK